MSHTVRLLLLLHLSQNVIQNSGTGCHKTEELIQTLVIHLQGKREKE